VATLALLLSTVVLLEAEILALESINKSEMVQGAR